VIHLAENLFRETQHIILGLNESMALAHSSNKTSIDAAQESKQALDTANQAATLAKETISGIEQVKTLQASMEEQAQAAATNLEHQEQAAAASLELEQERLSAALAQDITKAEKIITDVLKKEKGLNLQDKIEIVQAKEKIKQQLGIYEQTEKIRAQANIDATVGAEKEKWDNIHKIIENSKPIVKIAIITIATALCIYCIKYGIPMLRDYFARPRVISETSKTGWSKWFYTKPKVDIDDLIFKPDLQKQLFDLLLRVQCAKKYTESLPNVLFAKITNLNDANNELRKLLNWAKKSSKGLIVAIDEAESLFANRRLLTTSKATQDFINTFLSLISDQSQKKVMFIFATNHPFKLDDAITNRIGINIEFSLPQAAEREKILYMYLVKSAQKNKDAIVYLHPEIMRLLPKYADELDRFSPRAIKFIAEEMVICARQQESRQLTNDIAQEVIYAAKNSLNETMEWEKERNEWIGGLYNAQTQH
jgi:hypothetical protein